MNIVLVLSKKNVLLFYFLRDITQHWCNELSDKRQEGVPFQAFGYRLVLLTVQHLINTK